jgi:hypothetical protein
VLGSNRGLYSEYGHQFIPKSHKGGPNIVGIVLVFEDSPEPSWSMGQKTFTILQLTGQGELLAQVYKASRELQEPSPSYISSIDDKSGICLVEFVVQRRYPSCCFEVNFERGLLLSSGLSTAVKWFMMDEGFRD